MMRSKSPQRGLAVVEFALVLPVVLVILFGIFEFGFAFWRKQVLTAAVREGARMAILATSPRKSGGQVEDAVETYMTNVGLTPSANKATCINPCTVAGAPVTVSATFPTSFLILSRLEFAGIAPSKNITASVTMQCE